VPELAIDSGEVELLAINTAYSETVMLALERQRSALAHVDRAASAPGLSLADAWQVVTEALAEALDAARVSVWFLDEGDVTLTCVDLYLQKESRHESGTQLYAQQYPRYFAALTRERAIDAHDASTDPRTSEFAEGYLDVLDIRSMLDAPIRRDGKVRGVICVEHQGAPRRWRLDEVLCAGAACDQVAKILAVHEHRVVSVELALREEQVRQMQRLEAIGQLAGGIAHDFNNMLAGIMGSAVVAQESVSPENERAHEALSLILRSSERAGDLVTKLLAFSRKSKALWAKCDVHELLTDALTLFQRAGVGNVEIKKGLTAKRSVVNGDLADLQTAFLNLCINGGDAMASGGVLEVVTEVVDASELPPRLRASDGAHGAFLSVSVTDSGEGIAPEVMERIFEPFFTTKSRGKGTGLGLSAVYAIVRNHDGAIDVQSTLGKGTTFTLVLPLVAPEELHEATEIENGDATKHHKHANVLVVEDEEVLRSVARLLLEELGHSASLAETGEAAVEMVRENPCRFDLVILDMAMPGMSGETCFALLKEAAPEVPVVICTGFAHSSSMDRVVREGAVGVLHKPYTLVQLSEQIRNIVATTVSEESARED